MSFDPSDDLADDLLHELSGDPTSPQGRRTASQESDEQPVGLQSKPTKPRKPITIGPYRIEKHLGRGGMGTVFRAFHQALARPVALKCIRPDIAHKPILRERLVREARASARLTHPNIVQVYDILEHAGSDWIVMELAEGVTLDQLIVDGPLNVERGLAIARDVVRGLSAAHARNIVHRDLKTDNIIVGTSGQAKILDFGLAKVQDLHDESDLSTEGRILGTARAMSPEQAQGMPLDHRSDLFSFGTMLYEIFAGESPFRAEATLQTLLRVYTHVQTPLHELSPALPKELSDLVDKLLEKDPARRPQSAEEVLLALERLSTSRQRPSKILFVDDEPSFEKLVRLRYRRQLRAGTLDLEFASDGVEALEKLRADLDIHLVMADINMPRMDGLTLLGEIRALERPILTVMVSAYGDMSNIRRAMNLGAFDFVTKPIDFADLDTTRDKALEALRQLREHALLQRQNQVLEERNRAIRAAFGRSLRSGGAWAESGEALDVVTVAVSIRGFSDLARQLEGDTLMTAVHQLHRSIFDLLFAHGGLIVGWAPAHVDTDADASSVISSVLSFTAVFGLPFPCRDDVRHAVAWVEGLQRLVEDFVGIEGVGAGSLEVRAGLDVGAAMLEDPGPAGGGRRLTGPAATGAADLERHGTYGQVLLSKKAARRAGLAPAGASRQPAQPSGLPSGLEAHELNSTIY